MHPGLHSNRDSVTFDRRVAQLPWLCQGIHTAGSYRLVSSSENPRRRRVEDGLPGPKDAEISQRCYHAFPSPPPMQITIMAPGRAEASSKDSLRHSILRPRARRVEALVKDFLVTQGSSSTLATGVNNTAGMKENGKTLGHITSLNCNHQGHYATKCPKPRKDFEGSSSDRSNLNASTSDAPGPED